MSQNIQHLASTVETLECAVGNAVNRMGSTMEQNAVMMKSINTLMESYLVGSLKMNVTVNYDTLRKIPLVTLSVMNESMVPIENGIVTVDIRHGDVEPENENIQDEKVSGIYSCALRSPWRSDELIILPGDCKTFSVYCNLPIIDVFQLVVLFEFPSPGTGEMLSKSMRVNVQEFDQCDLVKGCEKNVGST